MCRKFPTCAGISGKMQEISSTTKEASCTCQKYRDFAGIIPTLFYIFLHFLINSLRMQWRGALVGRGTIKLCCGTAGRHWFLRDSPAECGTVGKYGHYTLQLWSMYSGQFASLSFPQLAYWKYNKFRIGIQNGWLACHLLFKSFAQQSLISLMLCRLYSVQTAHMLFIKL